MKLRLLLDENLSPALREALRRHDADIDVLRVGDAGASGLGTSDPEILVYLEQHQRALITDNRASMPGHVIDHSAAGGQHWGIFTIRPRVAFAEIIEAPQKRPVSAHAIGQPAIETRNDMVFHWNLCLRHPCPRHAPTMDSHVILTRVIRPGD